MSRSEMEKRRIELHVFQMLAPLIGWEVVPGSIEQPPPNRPDIECTVVGVGPRAVELTALDSSNTRQRLSNWHATRPAWSHALGLWDKSKRERLAEISRNLSLSLTIDEGTTGKMRTQIMHQIQALLLTCPDFSGRMFTAGAKPKGLKGGNAYRDKRRNGIRIHSFSAGPLLAPNASTVERKLTNRTYEAFAPLELFAYSVHDEPDGAVGWQEMLDTSIAKYLPNSLFKSVHLFHFGFGRHIKSYP
jgi:hypothetical protein